MDDVTRGLAKISSISSLLTQWNLEAMDDWHREHPVESRVRLSSLTRDNYLYDQFVARAESACTPFPIRVPQYGRMRWLEIQDGDIDIAIWPKKVDPHSFLTTSYPTGTALRRQRDWKLFGENRIVFFVCGHTIHEDLAGSDAWIDQVMLTQEARDHEGVRRVTLQRSIYFSNVGALPLQVVDPQLQLIPDLEVQPPAASTSPRPPRVVARKAPVIANTPQMPKVGIDAARRAERAAKKSKNRDAGSQGA